MIKIKPKKHNKLPRFEDGTANEADQFLNELSGTKWDPLRFKAWADTDEEARQYLVDHDIRLNDEGDAIRKYFADYVKSEGYERIINNQYDWWKSRHPYRKWITTKSNISSEPGVFGFGKGLGYYVQEDYNNRDKNQKIFALTGYPSMSFHSPGVGTFIYKSPIREDGTQMYDERFPGSFVLGHEYAHRFPFIYRGNMEALEQNKNTEPGHDSKYEEKQADMWGLKYLLFTEGIYDSRSNKDVTPNQVRKLRKKYPGLRPLKQMDDKKAAWMLNNVTYNKTIKPKGFQV